MPQLLKPEQVADDLQIPARTLAQWRYQRRGPTYIKAGGAVRYPRDEYEAWKKARTVETSG